MFTIKDRLGELRDKVAIMFEGRSAISSAAIMVSVGSVVLGAVLGVFSLVRFFWFQRGIGLVVPGASLIVAGVAGLVALSGVLTWKEQRRAEEVSAARNQKEAQYLNLSALMMGQLTGSYNIVAEGQVRAGLSVWGSKAVLGAFVRRRQVVEKILARGGPVDASGTTNVPEDLKAELRETTAEVVGLMRQELAGDVREDLEPELKAQILDALFDSDGHGTLKP